MDCASAICSGGHGAQTEVLDQSFLLQLRGHRERFGDWARSGAVEPPDAQVNDVEYIEPEVPQVVVHGLAQLLGSERLQPVPLGVTQSSDLGHDVQLVRVGVQGFLDDLAGDVWAVEVGRIDVRDAQAYGLAQDGHGSGAVGRWAEHMRAR
jgi:hypothetical protein